MMRLLRATVGALTLALVAVAVPAVPANAAACDTRSSRTVTGGYEATISCSGTGTIHGYGSTLTDANLEALSLYQLYAEFGEDCDGRSTRTVTGGYQVTLWCSSLTYIDGYGSNLTDAARAVRELAELYAATGMNCDGNSTGRVTGGFSVTNWCGATGFIEAYGTTVTDAAFEARALAELYTETGRDCDGSSVRTVSGGYEVTLWCSGLLFVEGRGSTVTGAARVARLSASL